MFIKKNELVKAIYCDGTIYTGTVYDTAVQLCNDDNNRPHALIFISQDKRFISEEGEFGCIALWVDKIKSLERL